jgi:hypothetical protein
MPRAYTVATAALALGMPVKWVDNILSHNKVPGIRQKKQGIARHLSIDGLLVLAITALLIEDLGLSASKAIIVAERITKNNGQYVVRQELTIEIDVSALRTSLMQKLENAVEIAPIPRRGRPPQNKTGRLD